jgi:benzylsuccinate CoA-transferase BbsF subunit
MNLKSQKSRDILYDIIRTSDVVSNNFGPGAMERLGLGYDEVKAIKPDIIYLSMPMYGEDGPLANLLGVGMTISAVTGLMWQTGYQGEGPIGPGTHFPDHAANPYHAAFAIMAALRHRRATGRGLKIDLSQVESTINCMGLPFLEYAMTGQERERMGNRSPFHAPHNIFACQGTDDWCAIAVETDSQWQTLCRVAGLSELADDPALADAA